MGKIILGRENEIVEIVHLKRAAEVGRLMLGELDRPLLLIRQEDYIDKPRRELKAELIALRSSLKRELDKFCRKNFRNVTPEDLAVLYKDIVANDSHLRLPLHDFIKQVGKFNPSVLKGVPSHATVSLSPWGLQTEYPEMHLARDVALAYNDAHAAHEKIMQHGTVHYHRAKNDDFRIPLSITLSRGEIRDAHVFALMLQPY